MEEKTEVSDRDLDPVLGGGGVRAVRPARANSGDLDLRDLLQNRDVNGGAESDTDNADANRRRSGCTWLISLTRNHRLIARSTSVQAGTAGESYQRSDC
jgi:hypothetical protein